MTESADRKARLGAAGVGPTRLLSSTAACLVLLLASLPAAAADLSHFEDFLTTQYRDAVNTTAWWDTLSGQLKLNPFAPNELGYYDSPGSAMGVAVDGDHVFLADGSSGLLVVDVSDPTSPVLTGTCDTPGGAWRLVTAGDLAFIADVGSGLQVIDVSTLSTPTIVGTYDTPGNAYGLAVSGYHVFVADGTAGLQIISVSNPASPWLVGTYNTSGSGLNVAVSGDYAYVADGGWGLQVIDISNVYSPTLAGNCDTPGTAYEVAISGNRAYVADYSSGLQVMDISNPASPSIVGSIDTPGQARGVVVCGDYAYVSDFESGIHVIDISNPASPSLLWSYDTPGSAYTTAVSGDYAYVADYTSGLRVVEVLEPIASPFYMSSVYLTGASHSVALDGNLAVLGTLTKGLAVVDISDPLAPASIGSYDTPGTSYGVCVSGKYAYLADYTPGLKVFDISTPSAPVLVDTLDTPGSAMDVVVDGNCAYVADYSPTAGLTVIDISDPTDISLLATWGSGAEFPVGVAVSGNYAYLAGRTAGLYVVSIANPGVPVLTGTCDTPDLAVSVAVSGNYAYVADYAGGLQVIDISNPASPSIAGTCATPDLALGLTLSGDRAYVATGAPGVVVIDITDPTTPVLLGTCDTPFYARDVAVAGDYVFVADDLTGLCVAQAYQSDLETDDNVGQSLPVCESDYCIPRVKLVTSQEDSVSWFASSNGGTTWTSTPTDGEWYRLSSPDNELMWKSNHFYTTSGVNPACNSLTLSYLYTCAWIDSVVDVPDDQGGWVRVYFTRSGLDFEDEPAPIAKYTVYRRASLEPETWEIVQTVPGHQESQYVALVPSLADSSEDLTYTVCYVKATTTGLIPPSYSCPPDSGYSVDNLSPQPPQGLSGQIDPSSLDLVISWDENAEPDLAHYAVYKGDGEAFVPGDANLLGTTTETCLADPGYDPTAASYYKVSAWDVHCNESGHSLLAPGGVVGVSGPPAAYFQTALEQNSPNPFNPVTAILFSLATPGRVRLAVYDLTGRVLRVLVDGPREAGRHVTTWDGRDSAGREVASGVYMCELLAPGSCETRKMVLLK